MAIDPRDPTENVRQLLEAAMSHIQEVIRLQTDFAEKYRTAESGRIDAKLLALETASRATADALAMNVKSVADSTNARIAALEKGQYESKGSGTGMRELWGWVFAAAMGLFQLYNLWRK